MEIEFNLYLLVKYCSITSEIPFASLTPSKYDLIFTLLPSPRSDHISFVNLSLLLEIRDVALLKIFFVER